MQNMIQKLVIKSQGNMGVNVNLNRICTRDEFCGSLDIISCGGICGILDLDPDLRKSRDA